MLNNAMLPNMNSMNPTPIAIAFDIDARKIKNTTVNNSSPKTPNAFSTTTDGGIFLPFLCERIYFT